MKKLITLILIAAFVMATASGVYAEAEYIDLEGVPYEEYFFQPWFTTDSMPYIIEPDMAVWMVFYNLFLRYGQIYGVENNG